MYECHRIFLHNFIIENIMKGVKVPIFAVWLSLTIGAIIKCFANDLFYRQKCIHTFRKAAKYCLKFKSKYCLIMRNMLFVLIILNFIVLEQRVGLLLYCCTFFFFFSINFNVILHSILEEQ